MTREWRVNGSMRAGQSIVEDTDYGHRVVADVYGYDAELVAAAPEMLAMLEKLEWSGGYGLACPECCCCQGEGHDPRCRLDALIKKARG